MSKTNRQILGDLVVDTIEWIGGALWLGLFLLIIVNGLSVIKDEILDDANLTMGVGNGCQTILYSRCEVN